MDMRLEGRRDVRAFVKRLEHAVIDAMSELGFAGRVGDEPGIWANEKKVASIGLALDDYISYHGISINYSADVLPGFARIRPCGIDPSLLGFLNVRRKELMDATLDSFSRTFGQFTEIDRELLPLL